MGAAELGAVIAVPEKANEEDGEVAELTGVTSRQTARSGTSWCCGEGEGDLRRPELGKTGSEATPERASTRGSACST